MRLLIVLFITFLSTVGVGQVELSNPTLRYVSKWNIEDLLILKLGSHTLFEQQCSPSYPSQIPNGIVYFENVYYQDRYKCSVSIEFKDTVVSVMKVFFNTKDQEILTALGFSAVKADVANGRKQWTYTNYDGIIHTSIIGDKKRIVVIQTI